jgi:predicted nucleic acid-binding protein
MVVIAAASPLNYLVLIDQIELLPRLFTEVFVPNAVLEELNRPQTPPEVVRWVESSPAWIRVVVDRSPRSDSVLDTLGMGEKAAISFAETARPDVLLVIDDADGRRVARQRQIPVIGILGFLETSTPQGLVSLPDALSRLRQTNLRMTPELIEAVLERDRFRRTSSKSAEGDS